MRIPELYLVEIVAKVFALVVLACVGMVVQDVRVRRRLQQMMFQNASLKTDIKYGSSHDLA